MNSILDIETRNTIADVLKQEEIWYRFSNSFKLDMAPRLMPVANGRHHHLMERLAGVPAGTYDSLEGLENPSKMTGNQFTLFKFLELGWGEIYLTIPENQELEYAGSTQEKFEMIELLEYVEGLSQEAKRRAVEEIKNGNLKGVYWS